MTAAAADERGGWRRLCDPLPLRQPGNVTQRVRGEKVAAASLNTPHPGQRQRARPWRGRQQWRVAAVEVWVDGVKVSTLTC